MLYLRFLGNIIAGKEEVLDLGIRFPGWKAAGVFSDGKVLFPLCSSHPSFLPLLTSYGWGSGGV